MTCCDPNFDISKFKHRVTFQYLSLIANDSGGQAETWTTFLEVWASVTPKIVKEVNYSQRIEPRTDHVIRTRWFTGLTPTMRVSFNERIFELKAVVNVEENKEFYELLATERTGT